MKPDRIFLLSGKRGFGKDSVGAVLAEQYGFRRVAFADHLKRVCRELGWSGRKDPAGRRLLIDVGCAVRRYDPDFWVRSAFADVTDGESIVVTDWRFRSEAEYLLSEYGADTVYFIRVTRPMFAYPRLVEDEDPYADASDSERELDDFAFDVTVNNAGALEDLPGHVATAMYALDAIRRG